MKAAATKIAARHLPIKKENPPRLTPPQSEVMETGILESGFNCVLQMPTGSGKTWLAEKIIQETLAKGFRAIFLTPLRALAEELLSRWQNEFPKNCRVGIFTGDYGSAGRARLPVSFKEAQVLIMTPERLDLITRTWRGHWNWLPEVDLLVADEIHLLADRTRGARLEGSLNRFRRLNPFARILGLSATMGNRGELADWLDGVEYGSDWRPVPLAWKLLRYRKATEKPEMLREAVRKTLAEGGQTLVFVQSRRRAEALCRELQSCGIPAGHHHAGLARLERNKTENDFRTGKSGVLVTTSTLEMGINLPARQVILYDLQEFNGTEYLPLSVNTVWQRAGRAGRFGIDPTGEVVLFASAWEQGSAHYEKGAFEPICSRLNDPKMLAEQILAETGSGLSRTEIQLKTAFNGTLAAHQKLLPNIGAAVTDLIKAGMLTSIRRDNAKEEEVDKIGKIDENISDQPELYQLKVTRLGRVGVRHLLFPSTVLLFQKTLTAGHELSFFDLLLIIAASDDCQPLLPVDYEELEDLGDGLATEISHLWQNLATEIFEMLGITGKRLLSALKTALTVRLWTRSRGDTEQTAKQSNCYPFEVERLAFQAARLLQAMSEIVSICTDKADETPISSAAPSDQQFVSVSAEFGISLKEKIAALHRMVDQGLDEQSATLTLIKGIGAQTARRLNSLQCADIEDLAGMEPDDLAREKGISRRRAEQWIFAAQRMQKQFSAFYFKESGSPIAGENSFAWPPEVEPYRLRRALELKITGGDGGGIYRIVGGLEPHLVKWQNGAFCCDCADADKGNLCKHVLAVRLSRGDSQLRKLASRIKKPDKNEPLDLLALWMSAG